MLCNRVNHTKRTIFQSQKQQSRNQKNNTKTPELQNQPTHKVSRLAYSHQIILLNNFVPTRHQHTQTLTAFFLNKKNERKTKISQETQKISQKKKKKKRTQREFRRLVRGGNPFVSLLGLFQRQCAQGNRLCFPLGRSSSVNEEALPLRLSAVTECLFAGFIFSARNPKFMVRITSGCGFAEFEVVACHGLDAFFRFRCWNFDNVCFVAVTVVVAVVVTVVVCFRWGFGRVWDEQSPVFLLWVNGCLGEAIGFVFRCGLAVVSAGRRLCLEFCCAFSGFSGTWPSSVFLFDFEWGFAAVFSLALEVQLWCCSSCSWRGAADNRSKIIQQRVVLWLWAIVVSKVLWFLSFRWEGLKDAF